MPGSAAPRVPIVHLGEPAGPAADALLGRAVSERIGASVSVRYSQVPCVRPDSAAAPAVPAASLAPGVG